ncbi:MAG: hypothetical protein ACLFQ5_06690 [Oceanicaulis sp.]
MVAIPHHTTAFIRSQPFSQSPQRVKADRASPDHRSAAGPALTRFGLLAGDPALDEGGGLEAGMTIVVAAQAAMDELAGGSGCLFGVLPQQGKANIQIARITSNRRVLRYVAFTVPILLREKSYIVINPELRA